MVRLRCVILIQGSTNTPWLNKAEIVVALREEKDGIFHVVYAMNESVSRGEEILLDGEYSTSTFPAGTKVTFSVVNKERPELCVVPGGDESTDDDDDNSSTHLFERTGNFM